jgi:hypothetical protein
MQRPRIKGPVCIGAVLLCVQMVFGQGPARPRIATISVIRREVFDPADSSEYNFIGSLANSLHWRTRERVLRDELLFRQGDPYDTQLVYESERNIRALGIVGNVTVRCDSMTRDSAYITVLTQDRWTLGLNTGYKQGGGNTSFFATLKDDNLFGTGQKLSVGYDYSTDRQNPSGAEIDFIEPRSFGSHWRSRLQLKNSDDQRVESLFLEHPFYSEETEFAGGVYADYGSTRIRQFDGSTVTLDSHIQGQHFLAWGANSSGSSQKIRLASAYVRTRTDAGPLPVRVFDNLDLVTASFTLVEREYYRGRYIDNFGRVEDVPLGYQASMTLGKGIHFAGASATEYYLRASLAHSWGINERYYFNYGGVVSSFVSRGEFVETMATFNVTQHLILFPRYTIASRFTGTIGDNLSPLSQVVLGTQSGLRGYPTHEFSGTREVLFNLEQRFYPDWAVWFFHIGGTLFFDSGAVWDRQDRLSSLKGHSSIGFGIRIENAKQEGNGILRIDFAFNLDQRRFAQIILSSDQLFGGFSDIGFAPPTPFYPN